MTQRIVLALFAASLAAAGCSIETTEGCKSTCVGTSCPATSAGGSSGHTPSTSTAGADAACIPFCDRLEYCGVISSGNFQGCVDHCEAAFAANPQQTQAGCTCVDADACRVPGSSNDYQCPGAPLITDTELGGGSSSGSSGATSSSTTSTTSTSGTTGTSSSSSSGSTSGTSGDAGAGQCTRNQDCALNQDCVGGACLDRCTASCQCALDQSCGTDGYCRDNPPAQTACSNDCDCPSGHSCVNGWCN